MASPRARTGDQGASSRWRAYVDTGSASNVEPRALLDGEGLNYCRGHSRLALPERHLARAAGDAALARGRHGEYILRLRGELDLNR